MKNFIQSFLFLLIFSSISTTSYAQEKIIKANELPHEITTYLKDNFPHFPVIQAVVEKEKNGLSYEVILKDNISLEFDIDKNVSEIKANSQLPNSVIPSKILRYVSKNYPDNVIIAWERDDKDQQVKLDNKLELEFSLLGEFLRIDK